MKQVLEAGIAALKARDYSRAIALLESVAETAAQPLSTRAQMGLVAAYKATGNLKKSIALCTSLAKHPNTQVKTWADRTLTELSDRRPPKPPENQGKIPEIPPETGLVAPLDRIIAGTEPSKIPPSVEKPSADHKTGFLAFEPTVGQIKAKSKDVSPPPPPPKPPSFKTSEPEKSTATTPDTEKRADSPTDIPPSSADSYQLTWRNQGRAQNWRSLKPLKLAGFRLEAIACTIALFFVA
ncbi:MAG TPA: hypothetical protein DCS91_16900, partial [Microcoleaceae bacterium UBA11344]|nr:hypothetical protein [Microcoleaceae cyanobacterium UBA11344]